MVTTRSQGQASPEDILPLRSRRNASSNTTPVKKTSLSSSTPQSDRSNVNLVGEEYGSTQSGPASVADDDTIVVDLTKIHLPGEKDFSAGSSGGDRVEGERRAHKRFASEDADPDDFHSAVEEHLLSSSGIRGEEVDEELGHRQNDDDEDERPEEISSRTVFHDTESSRTPRTPRSRKKQKIAVAEPNETADVASSAPSFAETDDTITASSILAESDLLTPDRHSGSWTELTSKSTSQQLQDNKETNTEQRENTTTESATLSTQSSPNNNIPDTISSPTISDNAEFDSLHLSSNPLLYPPPTVLSSGKSIFREPDRISKAQFSLPNKSSMSLHKYQRGILSRHRTQPAWTGRKVRFV